MAKKDANQYLDILRDIRSGNFKPVYFLMGEESYFIDLITEAIIKHALTDDERDFNQTIMYGAIEGVPFKIKMDTYKKGEFANFSLNGKSQEYFFKN